MTARRSSSSSTTNTSLLPSTLSLPRGLRQLDAGGERPIGDSGERAGVRLDDGIGDHSSDPDVIELVIERAGGPPAVHRLIAHLHGHVAPLGTRRNLD